MKGDRVMAWQRNGSMKPRFSIQEGAICLRKCLRLHESISVY